jgi:signal peptidase I
MGVLCRIARSLRIKRIHRWLLAAGVGAVAGIAAGRTVIASVSGSVSIVDGLSMAPAYPPGTRVYTAPITTPLRRGDVVLLDDGDREYALKRIVGLPGETVHLWRGSVFINRRLLREPYLARLTYTFPDERTRVYAFQLGPDQYLVLGDNRSRSIDSRVYGPVERKQIYSRVPAPATLLRPELAHFALPLPGRRTLQPL